MTHKSGHQILESIKYEKTHTQVHYLHKSFKKLVIWKNNLRKKGNISLKILVVRGESNSLVSHFFYN